MQAFDHGRRRLPLVLMGNGLMRIAGGAGGVLVGLSLSDLANEGHRITATLVGTLGAAYFAAELFCAVPMGMLADIVTPRKLMIGGGLLGAGAIQLMGITDAVPVFFASRSIEGLVAAASVPSILSRRTAEIPVTYSTPIHQMAARDTINRLLNGTQGRIIRGVSKLVR